MNDLSRFLPRYSSPFKPSSSLLLRSTPRSSHSMPPPPPPPPQQQQQQQQDPLLTTFRIRTTAHTVTLHGSWTRFATGHPLTRDPRSRHLWKTNLPGLQMGETYWYYFIVDGRVVLDPTNADAGVCEGLRASVLFSPILVEEEPVEEPVYDLARSRPSLSYSVESLDDAELEEKWPLRMGASSTEHAKAGGEKEEGKDFWGVGMGLNYEGAGLRRVRSLRWMRERMEEEVLGLRDEIGRELAWVAGVVA